MQAWLIQGDNRGESEPLASVFRQWMGRSENSSWTVDCVRWTAELALAVHARRPDVLVLAESCCPAGSWLADSLAHGAGLVAAVSLERADTYRALGDQFAVQLTPLPPTVEGLGMAMLNVLACLRRQRGWQARIDQLQQRLNDRIIIERAKGILVERLGVSEKEAYMRLRVLSRRQRRQIRDIAQSLIDTQSLLLPEGNTNGAAEPPHRDFSPPLDRPGAAS